jgi:hypothetical protein
MCACRGILDETDDAFGVGQSALHTVANFIARYAWAVDQYPAVWRAGGTVRCGDRHILAILS